MNVAQASWGVVFTSGWLEMKTLHRCFTYGDIIPSGTVCIHFIAIPMMVKMGKGSFC